tara:strand:+ start:2304 stop:2738 length:435 start_codon:yes stop_codon:yes gene_type:complete
MNTCPSDKMVDLDQAIIDDMSSTEESKHYRRYLTDRFLVTKIHEIENGLCAHVHDRETGEEVKLHTGDPLADGTVEVIDEGVVFNPPRADVESFVLESAQEMMPIGNHKATKTRDKMNDVLEREHMMMPYDDQDDKMIIIELMR